MHANVTIHQVVARTGLGDPGRVLLAVLVACLVAAAQSASVSFAPGQPVAAATNAPGWESVDLGPAAARLLAQSANNRSGLAAAGSAALTDGRNEATIAAFLGVGGTARLAAGLERFGRLLASSDRKQLAQGVAGVQHYSELIHSTLLRHGPARLVTVSVQAQRLLAYDHGRVVLDTLVTTGRPALPTDIGAMRVVHKDSPWTMKSPWPKGSPYWYPDTVVQMVAWFTTSGEGLHDAAWEPLSAYGPGSQNGPFASHGCIHVPPAAESTLFAWVQIGTPVVVYPGDGTPMADQLAQRTVDAVGNPVSGVRGD